MPAKGYANRLRETMPYCEFKGIGLVPWSALGRGTLARPWVDRTSDERTQREKEDIFFDALLRDRETECDKTIIRRVEELAHKKGVSMAGVATAWSMAKGCMPITGANSIERLDQALEALSICLDDDEMKYLEEPYVAKKAVPFV